MAKAPDGISGPAGESAASSKAELVYAILRRRIRELVLPPGAQLRREDIAAEFGVSRAPVREAVSRLAAEGLVEVFERSGSYVAPIRPADVRESVFIRTALELEAVSRLAGSPPEALIARLRDNVEDQEAALAAGDLAALHDLDERFHQLMWSALASPRAQKLMEAARAPLDRVRRVALPESGRPEATVAEHRVVLQGIESGDPAVATLAMRMHLSKMNEAVERALGRIGPGRTAKDGSTNE